MGIAIGQTMSKRKNLVLRIDPAVHDALARWAADELRRQTRTLNFYYGSHSMTPVDCPPIQAKYHAAGVLGATLNPLVVIKN